MAAPASSPYPRQALLERLAEARALTDALFPLVRPEAIYDRTIPERHRLIFYLGHVEAFDWNLFAGTCDLKRFNAEFDELFSFGIDPVDGNLPSDQPSDWPARSVIESYNSQVREKLDAFFASPLASDPSKPALPDGTLLHVAIEHRLMHAETLAYLLHQLPLDRKIPQNERLHSIAPPFEPHMVTIPEGAATLGQSRSAGKFGWDNEFEIENVRVPEFRIDAYPVTNGQFLAFVRAGGYDDRSLWSKDDWEWKTAEGISHPQFWIRRGDDWHCRAMFSQPPLPLAWPAYVSQAEASAYARWAGKSLPSEPQWHRAAYGTPEGAERAYPWGSEPPSEPHGNFNFRRWDPEPVTAHPDGASAFGVFDLLGNGWERTRTPFRPLPGFQPFPFYPGYSANFFDGKHFVMKGGSPRTAACMVRRSFRNWFQPHYPYVFATFRCVED
jgi:ergothioneine biosynthesis protein EgtB